MDVPPAPLDTPEVFNTIDTDTPTSQVLPLNPTQSSPTFELGWSGEDLGAGIRDYSIFVSEDGGMTYSAWLSNTTDTSATFTGHGGNEYAFYSIARDGVGNVEEKSAVPEAVTRVRSTGDCTGDCNGDQSVTIDELLAMVNIALGDATVSTCIAGDSNRDGQITIDELVQAVDKALNGCSS